MSTSTVVSGRSVPDRRDGGGEAARTAVGQVVAGHAGDHGVGQAHPLHGVGHPLGLAGVERQGMAGVDLAEPAGPGAPRAVDHEGGGPVGPALVDVRAAGLLAHRDQVEVAEVVLEPEVVVAHAGLDPQPGRLARGQRAPRPSGSTPDRRSRRSSARAPRRSPPRRTRDTGHRLRARRRPRPSVTRWTSSAGPHDRLGRGDDRIDHLGHRRTGTLRPPARSPPCRRSRRARCGRTWTGRGRR